MFAGNDAGLKLFRPRLPILKPKAHFMKSQMLKTIKQLSIGLLFVTTAAASELDDVYNFIQQHAENRTLRVSDSGTFAGDTVAYDFHRDMTICNLHRTKKRFTFDVIYSIRSTVQDLKDGKKVGKTRSTDRMLVERQEFGFRRSTGKVVGFSTIITTTRADSGGGTTSHYMELKEGELHVKSETAGYEDYMGPNDSRYPGAMTNNIVWLLRENKLVIQSELTTYKVDPKTGQRTFLQKLDLDESVEVAKLPLD